MQRPAKANERTEETHLLVVTAAGSAAAAVVGVAAEARVEATVVGVGRAMEVVDSVAARVATATEEAMEAAAEEVTERGEAD